MEMKVKGRVRDLIDNLGYGVITDIYTNDTSGISQTMLTVDFGGDQQVDRLSHEVQVLPDEIIADYIRQKWVGDVAKTLEELKLDATSVVMGLDWEALQELEDNQYSSDEIGHLLVDHDGPFEVAVLSSLCDYLGIDAVDKSLSEAVKAGELNEEHFMQAKLLHDDLFREAAEIRLMDARKAALEQKFEDFLNHACGSYGFAGRPDYLAAMMQAVAQEASNVAERLRDVIPGVRFGDSDLPCWRVELVTPVTEFGNEKRSFILVHAETGAEARDLAMEMMRLHFKNAMRLAYTGEVESYTPVEPELDDFEDDSDPTETFH